MNLETSMRKQMRSRRSLAAAVAMACGWLMVASLLSGCVAVGYSSGGGWFIWPGGLGLLLVVVVIVVLLLRR
jgi:protein-S-isoprenylcysteine O-methyltransferase Ste14